MFQRKGLLEDVAVRYSICIEDVDCHCLLQDSAEPIALQVYWLYSGLIINYLITQSSSTNFNIALILSCICIIVLYFILFTAGSI